MRETLTKALTKVYELETKCVKLSTTIIEAIEKSDKMQSKLERVEHLHEEYWKQQDRQPPNDALKELIDRTKKILDDD